MAKIMVGDDSVTISGERANIKIRSILSESVDQWSGRPKLFLIHGMGGNAERTWRPTAGKHTPIQTLCSENNISALYISHEVKKFGGSKEVRFEDAAALVCDALLSQRLLTFPCSFFGYSGGGTLLKVILNKLCLKSEFFQYSKNISSLVFLGTPHSGTSRARYARFAFPTDATRDTIPESRMQMSFNSDFKTAVENRLREVDLFSVYETQPIRFEIGKLGHVRLGSGPFIAPNEARLNWECETAIPASTDHLQLPQFLFPEGQKTLLNVTQDLLRRAKLHQGSNMPMGSP